MSATRKGSVDPRAFRIASTIIKIAVVIVLVGYPLVSAPYNVERFTIALTLSIAILSLNLLTGFTGLISIGHSAFFGIGAYACVILGDEQGIPMVGAVAIGVVIAFVSGMICSLPALRVGGHYFALTTLALAVVFPQLLLRFDDLTGGSAGHSVEQLGMPKWVGSITSLQNDQFRYYVVLASVGVTFMLVRNLVHGRIGHALIAIRDNPTVAEMNGVKVASNRIVTFGISAALAAFAGELFVLQTGYISTQDSYITLAGAISLLAAAVIGGITSIYGAAVGAVIVLYLPDILGSVDPRLSQVLFGAVLVVLMIFAPGGLAEMWRRFAARLRGAGGDFNLARDDAVRVDST